MNESKFSEHTMISNTSVLKKISTERQFASLSSTQNLQTNQFRDNPQEKLLEFWRRLQWSLFENPRINIRDPEMIFLGENDWQIFDIFANWSIFW